MARKLILGTVGTALMVLLGVAPAWACGGLVAPNGTVRLLRTSTLAAYADGVEHYVTSFQFAGGGAEFGSIVPLPAVPTKVERGGDWTLQRLQREVAPPAPEALAVTAADAGGASRAKVLLETRIDALDLTVLEGGGQAVGDWAREHGFQLTPDAPEVLDHYAAMSPIFLAARFDAAAANERAQGVGDGTPIHLTMPTDHPWVPLKILGLGRTEAEIIEADVFLLTDQRPARIDGTGTGVSIERLDQASELLISDLRSDKGMEWMPDDMWLTYLRIDAKAADLTGDLDINKPSEPVSVPAPAPSPTGGTWWWGVGGLVAAGLALVIAGLRRPGGTPVPA